MRPDLYLPGPGWITIEHEAGGRRVLCLSGEVDTAVVAHFYTANGAVPLVVDQIDAGAVTFLSSTGLSVLLRCARESQGAGRRPVLRASSRLVDRLLARAGVAGLLAPLAAVDDDPGAPQRDEG